jgi:uncharacterized protein (UPF0147 family)
LLKPLSKDKADVMNQLLESVQTKDLKSAYAKYLTPVMDDKNVPSNAKKVISEAKGDRAVREDADLTNIRKLAGIQH